MTQPTPREMLRDLRNFLVDLNLSGSPHTTLINEVYCRLAELEEFVGKVHAINQKYLAAHNQASRMLHPSFQEPDHVNR